MKQRTHSGAKKRLKATSSGKVKRKQTRMRHLNSHMSSKRKRHLGDVVYVDDANMTQIARCLLL
ncbi:MAG: 50S ribosomal protein L35 [Oligoflexia bacterium]|nr:MAG: 50S ribosomal protein L35 [Oligoflexia bacterium]